MPEVWIPTTMLDRTDQRRRVTVAGSTVRQVIDNLERIFPGIKDKLCLDWDIMPGISVIVDGETSRLGLLERVGEGSEIHFLPAIGGGAAS